MGFLKWLKRDMSPASNRRVSAPPTTANKLTRNESYLRALSKFNKWRQMHLAVDCPNTKYNKKLPKSVNSFNQTAPTNNDEHLSNISSEEDLDASQMIYEEIDLNSREPKFLPNNSNKLDCSTGERVLVPLGCDNSLLESTNYENKAYHRRYYNSNVENIVNSLDFNDHPNDDYQRVLDESEYALPYSNCSTKSGAVIYGKYVERNFDIVTPKTELSECPEETRRLMITDLDKSQETIATFEENCTQADQIDYNSASSENIDFFSELMVCPLARIDVDMEESGFNITNGFIQHGEIDSVEISYIQMKENYHDAIYNSFATLRKLRHPNIILLMGVSMDESSTLEALITEPLKCTLYDSIHFEKNRIPLESCHRYALEITNALIYLHKHEIIHSNICSQNIILCRATETIKLGGFELNISAKNIRHENDKSAEPPSPKSEEPLQQHLPLSVEYRKRYTQHFYQAPELLTEKEYIQPTYQSDVYGISITLWEMLNCAIPYLKFNRNELIKVFSLKNAQLPAFEEERCLPFKAVLESGLQIQMDCRIANAVLLKSKLKQVNVYRNVQQNELGVSADQFAPHDSHSITKLSHHYKDLHYTPYERTSTIKKRRTAAKLNRAGPKAECNNNFEEPCSPITRATTLDWSTENNTESISATKKVSEQMLNDRNKLNLPDDSITPRRYSVNILIKSKGSPGLSPFQNNMNDSPKMSNVKEKINKFESFLTSSPSFNRFGDSVRSEEKLANNNNYESNIENNIKMNYKSNLSTLDKENENPFAKLQFRLISTEDLYIDDDFPNDCNLGGANFELDFNYVHDNFT